jgi:uncharacterized protein (DUF1697 family)
MVPSMIYVALLRGINVGGNRKVEMAALRETFSRAGCKDVSTYINSGNVLFSDDREPELLIPKLETAIAEEFGFEVPVLLRNIEEIRSVVASVPEEWVHDSVERTDVWFLWDDFDTPAVVDGLSPRTGVDEVRYVAGAVVWRATGRLTSSRRGNVAGTPLYKSITIRNINTVRRIHASMEERVG